ncbi:hypothetical protein B0F90DRAFT_1735271, partial [Multifurca ochricompacta]
MARAPARVNTLKSRCLGRQRTVTYHDATVCFVRRRRLPPSTRVGGREGANYAFF